MSRKIHSTPHRYQRRVFNRRPDRPPYVVFACNLPNCPHYIREELVVGKESLCNRCGREFIMTAIDAKRAKPHCVECTRGYKKKEVVEQGPALADVALNLDQLLKGTRE